MCAGSANTGSGLPAPNGPARAIVAHSSAPAAGFERDAGGHGMTAPLGEKPVGDGAAHRTAEIDPGNRAPRAGADAGRIERDGERRTPEFLLQPRGHETQHAGMPS